MITDEQVRIACKAFYGNHIQPDCCCDEELQVIRRALKAYEQSKWVKFDVNDESTYPPLDQVVMCKPFNEPVLQMSLIHDAHPQFDGFFFEDERGFYRDIKCIAYWQYLPDYATIK